MQHVWGKSRVAYRVLMGIPEGKRPLGENRRIVQGRWIGMIWLRTGTSGGNTLKEVNKSRYSIKQGELFDYMKKLLDSHKGLWLQGCTELGVKEAEVQFETSETRVTGHASQFDCSVAHVSQEHHVQCSNTNVSPQQHKSCRQHFTRALPKGFVR